MNRLFLITLIISITLACREQKKEPDRLKEGSMNTGSYGFDRLFLSQVDSSLIQLNMEASAVLVSPKYQAKVFTSTADGADGISFGWINYKAFSARPDPHMNAYGGENRFWLGPEGGAFSLFFRKGAKMVFDNWRTPPAYDTEAWQLERQDDTSVTMSKDMQLISYTGDTLLLDAKRKVTILRKEQVEELLSLQLGDSVNYVGYTTDNSITNTGANSWNDTTGMPCIWILDMFSPTASTTIVIPFRQAEENEKVATTDYFGAIGKDRLKIGDSVIFFKADGRKRGKMGVLPKFAKPLAGSFDASRNVLTVTYFDVNNEANYLNQEWNTTAPVYSGDAMNAYNDGPLADGTQMGPFYELESVSPAVALAPGETMSHRHSVFHFTGKKDELDVIATTLFGVGLSTIENAFKK